MTVSVAMTAPRNSCICKSTGMGTADVQQGLNIWEANCTNKDFTDILQETV